MARKNRRTNKESERFKPSKELLESISVNKNKINDYEVNKNNRRRNSNNQRIS